MKKTGTTRSDFDDEFYFPSFGGGGSIVIYEEDPPPPQPTGLLDYRGQPIYRIPVPKPPIGFCTDPDLADLYDFDPEVDYVYSGSLDKPTEGEGECPP